MKSTQNNSSWLDSKKEELKNTSSILESVGFSLDEQQPHISGERYLMTKDKFVLAGKRVKDGTRVIIKASLHHDGQREIEAEKNARDLLQSLSFADKTIVFRDEIYFGKHGDVLIWITLYIPQEKVFVAHELEEQFFLALQAFEAQEAFHATTFEHLQNIKDTFPVYNAGKNIRKFETFTRNIIESYPDKNLHAILSKADEFLKSEIQTIESHSRYLVHQDFVPHNFRIQNKKIYMLDCSSVYFSNKYEGWARFLNYMIIHNPDLEKLLVRYIIENRGEKEYLSLRLMRVLKIGELLEYYARSFNKTMGDLHTLTEIRIQFWHKALVSLLDDKPLSGEIRDDYITKRNALRSPEEKERQREFAVV